MSNLRGKNIILFGPPGMGKSTIIKKLIEMGYPAIDLEEVYPNKYRFEIPNKLHNAVIGAADLDPKKYNDQVKVLLYLSQDEYDKRRAARDQDVPGKASQKHHDVDAWKKGIKYDHIFYADNSVISKVVSLL